jgi:hypothetical protein
MFFLEKIAAESETSGVDRRLSQPRLAHAGRVFVRLGIP